MYTIFLPKQEERNFIGSAKRSILKLVKLQSLVAKCYKIRNISLATFANFVYICITRGDAYYFFAHFGLNVVGLHASNTNTYKFWKLCKALFFVFYNLQPN